MTHQVVLEAVYHIANAVALIAYLFRNQLNLRITIIISMILQSAYYLFIPAGPLWDPLIWKGLTITLNIGMIMLLFHDRLNFGIDPEVRPLFDAIGVLTPGQFRRLIRGARRIAGPLPMIERGHRPNSLFYVIDGFAEVRKDGRRLNVGRGTFLGEIAFLTHGPATADVSLQAAGRALDWNVDQLRALMHKDKAIDIAIRGLLSQDLARKTSQSDLPSASSEPSIKTAVG